MYLKAVTISISFKIKPIKIISIEISNCVVTLDKLAKKPYLKKVKSIIDNFTRFFHGIFSFEIKINEVIKGAKIKEIA